MLINCSDPQNVLLNSQNPKLCFRTNLGTNQAKNVKISISQAIQLGFLHSLVSDILYEANKSNQWCEERPIGLLAVKMFSCMSAVLHSMWQRRTRVPMWEHICKTGWYDVKDRRAQKVQCVMAHWKTRPGNRNQLSKTQRVEGKCQLFSWFS